MNLAISLTGLSRRRQKISLQSAKIHDGRRDARTGCSIKRVMLANSQWLNFIREIEVCISFINVRS